MGRIKIALIASAACVAMVGVGAAAFVFGEEGYKQASGDVSFVGDAPQAGGHATVSIGLPEGMTVKSADSSKYSDDSGFSTLGDLYPDSGVLEYEDRDDLYVRVRFSLERDKVENWIENNCSELDNPTYLSSFIEPSNMETFRSQFQVDEVSCYFLYSGEDSPAAYGAGEEFDQKNRVVIEGERSGVSFYTPIYTGSDIESILSIGISNTQSWDLVFGLKRSDQSSNSDIANLSFNVGLSVRRAKVND